MADVKEKQEEIPIEEPKKKAQRLTADRYRKDCGKLFGVSTSTFDGATYGLDGKYTVKEMRDIIELWLSKVVKKEVRQ